MIESTTRAVNRQDYENVYMLQAIPVLGALVSIPTALFSGAMAIAKLAQALFQKISNGTPFLTEEKNYTSSMEDAVDLSLIFANNVLNICTLGICNNIIICCCIGCC
jgi:hypothetical protein